MHWGTKSSYDSLYCDIPFISVVWNQTAISLKSAVSPMSGILQLNSAHFNPHHFIPGPPQLQAACQSLPDTFCLPAKSSSFCRMWLSGKDTD